MAYELLTSRNIAMSQCCVCAVQYWQAPEVSDFIPLNAVDKCQVSENWLILNFKLQLNVYSYTLDNRLL